MHSWWRHGESLTIRSDGTGEAQLRTYNEPEAGQDMYYEYDTMSFRLASGGGALIGTVTAVRYASGSGTPLPPPDEGFAAPGDTFAYRLKPTGALNRHRIRPPQPADEEDQAYCTDGVADEGCGA
jgi:hypothetical protein